MPLADIIPDERPLVINLVRDAGVDVSDWSNGKGGAERASMNPKYCYEWSFVEPGKIVVLNIWHEAMLEHDAAITCELNMRRAFTRESVTRRKVRAAAMDLAILTAFVEGLAVRVIVLAGKRSKPDTDSASRALKRMLDPTPWAVVKYDFESGAAIIARGYSPMPARQLSNEDTSQWFEGSAYIRYAKHRIRELDAREAKLKEARQRNGGRLICEVPNCGFDFAERYGEIGEGYAQVHHLEPLGDAPETGRATTLDKLAIVCANCHAMIHRGGKCRELRELVPSSSTRRKWSDVR